MKKEGEIRSYINKITAIDKLDNPITGTDMLSIRYAPDQGEIPRNMLNKKTYAFVLRQKTNDPKGFMSNVIMMEAAKRLKHGQLVSSPIPEEPESFVEMSEGLDISNPDKSWCLRQAAIEFAFKDAKLKVKKDPRIQTLLTAVLFGDAELAQQLTTDLITVARTIPKSYPNIKDMKLSDVWDLVLATSASNYNDSEMK